MTVRDASAGPVTARDGPVTGAGTRPFARLEYRVITGRYRRESRAPKLGPEIRLTTGIDV